MKQIVHENSLSEITKYVTNYLPLNSDKVFWSCSSSVQGKMTVQAAQQPLTRAIWRRLFMYIGGVLPSGLLPQFRIN